MLKAVGKGYDCLYDLFFDWREALLFFKFENVWYILKFTSVDKVTEDLLSESCSFENISGNWLWNAATMHFVGNTSLALELNYQPTDN